MKAESDILDSRERRLTQSQVEVKEGTQDIFKENRASKWGSLGWLRVGQALEMEQCGRKWEQSGQCYVQRQQHIQSLEGKRLRTQGAKRKGCSAQLYVYAP